MLKIGVIGTENSHALAFAQIINLPDPISGKMLYPDVRVVGSYGPDVETAQAIVDKGGAEFVASTPNDFFGKVDAMMITNRKGSLHTQYAMPFIEKGMPMFIDKPFTSCVVEAEMLVAAAKKSGSLIVGGSGCKMPYDIQTLAYNVREMRAHDSIISASMNFAADPDSEYDGFFFYSPHLTEMALEVFGPDVKSVVTLEKEKSRISIWRYDKFDVALHYTKNSTDVSAIIYGKNKNVMRNIDSSMAYGMEVKQFVTMLRTKEMPYCYEKLVMPVRMIAAVEESVKTGKEVFL